jgi:hypothetical protein
MEVMASRGYEKRAWSACYQKHPSLIPQVSIDFPSHVSRLWFNVLKQTFSVSANIFQLFLPPWRNRSDSSEQPLPSLLLTAHRISNCHF